MPARTPHRMRVIFVTTGSEEQAVAIARALVTERLAACVNIVGPVRSIYRWRDEVEDDREYLLIIKTRATLYMKVETRVRELHTYEVPEVLAIQADRGSPPYIQWLLDSTGRRAIAPTAEAAMIRIAISGAGAITERAHIPALRSVADAQIVAIQSRTADKAERVARALWPDDAGRPKIYSDFDEMLARERPDAVGIFTPNHLHCEFTLKALDAGAHVLVEKPMAPTAAEARKMVDAAAKARRVLMVAMQRRFGGVERAIKDAVASGAIGKPHFIRARLSHGGPRPVGAGAEVVHDALRKRAAARCSISAFTSPTLRSGSWARSIPSRDRSARSPNRSKSTTRAR